MRAITAILPRADTAWMIISRQLFSVERPLRFDRQLLATYIAGSCDRTDHWFDTALAGRATKNRQV